MLTSRTLGVSIRRPPAAVYEFVSNPANLPQWAPGLCQSVRREGSSWVVETPNGPMGIRFAESNPFGVLDHYVQPAAGPEIYVPMRVIPNADGSELIFTLFQLPDMTDEQFAADSHLVDQDLHRLKRILEA